MNPDTPISDIMTRDLVTVNTGTPISVVNEIFEDRMINHIPVLEKGLLVGIISKKDLLQVSHLLSFSWRGATQRFENFAARDIMTEYPLYLKPDDTVGLAADIILANTFHALPIIDDDELVGIVTSHDLIAFAYDSPVVESESVEYE